MNILRKVTIWHRLRHNGLNELYYRETSEYETTSSRNHNPHFIILTAECEVAQLSLQLLVFYTRLTELRMLVV